MTIGLETSNNEEMILLKWKKLQNDTQELVDMMTWTGTGSHYKHPLEVLLWDINRLVERLELGVLMNHERRNS